MQYTICHWAINRSDPQNLLSVTLDVPLQELDKVFIQAFGLACEVYVEVSPLCSLPTTIYEVADSVVCQVTMLPSFNSL